MLFAGQRNGSERLDWDLMLRRCVLVMLALGAWVSGQAWAEEKMIEQFEPNSAAEWQFVSDRVMGGVSNGEMQILSDGEQSFARLSGQVSTQNNGGFIQMRRAVSEALPAEARGLRLRVRGNGARYYVHLRPRAARRPWQYFQASFAATKDWQRVDLNWTDFEPQGGLKVPFEAAQITSLAIVAYGADYDAQLDVDWVAVR